MNVLFVNYGDFTSNSLNHIAGFAKILRGQGHACAVAVPDSTVTITTIADPHFTPITYADAVARPRFFPDGRAADIVHAWTPRELVRKFVLQYEAVAPAHLIVHFEDNERYLLEAFTGKPFAALEALSVAEQHQLLTIALAHPLRLNNLAKLADGMTVIVDCLQCFVPPGVPSLLLEPGVDPDLDVPQPPDPALRRELGLQDDEQVIVFTGGTSFANTTDVRTLYDAVVLLNQRGVRTRLVRTGLSSEAFYSTIPAEVQAFVIDLGFVTKIRLPRLVALASVLVQPGRAGPFNDFRLPSKLPEFLAAGKPVILPVSNVGRNLRDGVDAILLHTGTPAEIADSCLRVFNDRRFAATLGENAAKFARAHFDLARNSTRLLRFYEEVLARPTRTAWKTLRTSTICDVALLAENFLAGQGQENRASPQTEEILAQIRLLEDEFADVLSRANNLSEERLRLEKVAAEQAARINSLADDLSRRGEKITHMQRSFSWKITSSLRALRRVLFDRPQ